MASVYQQLRLLRHGDIPVLIAGETGTGKEHVARILHGSSDRRDGPFQAVNCAAIPDGLLEAELFGIEAGVATGVARREGKMSLASRGVILLDEVGDMSPTMQARLLRALQEKEVHPLGARNPIGFDARVIAATNRDLRELIAQGRFRADLYYRLAGYCLHVPPLRERRSDIPALVGHFLARFSGELEKPLRGISAKALNALVAHSWPGNVRELEQQVRRLVCLCPSGQAIDASLLAPDLDDGSDVKPAVRPVHGADGSPLAGQLRVLEREAILDALRASDGNLSAAARLLSVSRYGLRLKMKRLGIDAP